MSEETNRERVDTETSLQQLQQLLAKQHENYREMLQEPIDNSISATVTDESYYQDPEPFAIQLDFERTPKTCRVTVADAGKGMSREVIRDFVFSTGDTNYSNGILNNIGAGLKASICWCEETLQTTEGVSFVENGFHLISKEPGAEVYQRVDGPVQAGIEVYDSTDEELWRQGAEKLPTHEHGTRVHLTCGAEQFNEGVANVASKMSTKMRYVQEELGVKFQHLLRAHEGNQIHITFRDINEDGEVKEENEFEVIPISPVYKAKPETISVGSLTDYDSLEEFEEVVTGIDTEAFGEGQYGWATTTVTLEDTKETFYVSYEYGELDLEAMFEAVDAEERNLKITSPNTDGFRWRYKRNQDGTGVDVYGNGRILNVAEWVFDLTYNPQYNGYTGMLQIIPVDPNNQEVPTTNDKTGIDKSSKLWQEVTDWLKQDQFKPVSTYNEGSQSYDDGEKSGDASEDEVDDESDSEIRDDESVDIDNGQSDPGEFDDAEVRSDTEYKDNQVGEGDGSGDRDSKDDPAVGGLGRDNDGQGDRKERPADQDEENSNEDNDTNEDAIEDRINQILDRLEANHVEATHRNVEKEGVVINAVSEHAGAGDVLHMAVEEVVRPEHIYRAMLYQDHYKRVSNNYDGTIIWAVEATKEAEKDLDRVENRKDEHNEPYKIHLEDVS